MKKLALTIGISYMGSKHLTHLDGAISISHNLSKFLAEQQEYDVTNMNDMEYLINSPLYPSRENIVRQLIQICKNASDGDLIMISYLGHGIMYNCPENVSNKTQGGKQMINDLLQKFDKNDEPIVPADFIPSTRRNSLKNNQLNQIFSVYLKNKPNTRVFMLLDCLHNKQVTDLRYTYNYDGDSFNSFDNNIPQFIDSRLIVMSGSIDEKVNWTTWLEQYPSNESIPIGIMTNVLIASIRQNPKSAEDCLQTVRAMYRTTSKYMIAPMIQSNNPITPTTNELVASNRSITSNRSIPTNEFTGYINNTHSEQYVSAERNTFDYAKTDTLQHTRALPLATKRNITQNTINPVTHPEFNSRYQTSEINHNNHFANSIQSTSTRSHFDHMKKPEPVKNDDPMGRINSIRQIEAKKKFDSVGHINVPDIKHNTKSQIDLNNGSLPFNVKTQKKVRNDSQPNNLINSVIISSHQDFDQIPQQDTRTRQIIRPSVLFKNSKEQPIEPIEQPVEKQIEQPFEHRPKLIGIKYLTNFMK